MTYRSVSSRRSLARLGHLGEIGYRRVVYARQPEGTARYVAEVDAHLAVIRFVGEAQGPDLLGGVGALGSLALRASVNSMWQLKWSWSPC